MTGACCKHVRHPDVFPLAYVRGPTLHPIRRRSKQAIAEGCAISPRVSTGLRVSTSCQSD